MSSIRAGRTLRCEYVLRVSAIAALCVASLAIASASASANPRPVAAYSFDEGSGTTLHDSAGGHDGTIEGGASWTEAGKYGSALDFDGSNDLVKIADANDLDLTTAFTLEAWVRPDVLSGGSVITKGETPGGKLSGYWLSAAYTSEKPAGVVANGTGTTKTVNGPSKLTAATWAHVALSSDGSTLRLYVDGVQVATETAVAPLATAAPLKIGTSITGFFNGLIDEVRLYDETLSEAEIKADREAPVGLGQIPVAAYSFDEGSGTTLHDSAGGHDGTIEGGASWTEAGKYGSALDFDGSNDLVKIADANDLDLTTAFTLEAWVRPDVLSGGSVITKGETPGGKLSGYWLSAAYTSEKPAGVVANGTGTTKTVNGPSKLTAATWAHVALSSDGSTLRLYVDGVQVATETAVAPLATAAPLKIGTSITGFFNGLIDEVRLYDETLSEAEIKADREAPVIDGEFSASSLLPQFDREASDYAVRCLGSSVTVSASAAAGTSVSVDGQPPRGGSFEATVALTQGQAFEISIQGGPVARTYHVRCLSFEFPIWSYERLAQPSHSFYVAAPVPSGGGTGTAVIFDDYGAPIWWFSATTWDAKVLPSGKVAWVEGSPGAKIYNLDGTLDRTVKTVGSSTDIHEIQELPNGNILLLSYPERSGVNLTPIGLGTNQKVVDGLVQEIDPQGNVVWSWSTVGNISQVETGRWVSSLKSPYDLVHLNAIEPVGEDAIMISARNTDAVYKIDKASGEIVWKLGGTETENSLTVEGDPHGDYPLGAQHDVRLQPDGTITIHDNRSSLGDSPRAVRYEIDEESKTATFVEDVEDPEVSTSQCCGSARRSLDGSWLMSWGGKSLVTEFDSSGNRTFGLSFANFFSGSSMFSYRAVPVAAGLLTVEELREGMDARFPR
jgi:hypothetical protein